MRIIVVHRYYTQLQYGKTYPLRSSKAISQSSTRELLGTRAVTTAIECHVSSLSIVFDENGWRLCLLIHGDPVESVTHLVRVLESYQSIY